MRTRIFFYLFTVMFFFSCYKYEVPLFGYTKWEYKGDVIKNDITANSTIFDFITNDSVYIYEDDKLTDKLNYSFSVINRRGSIVKHNLQFERRNDNEMKVDHSGESYFFYIK